jgi:hypothetical protein
MIADGNGQFSRDHQETNGQRDDSDFGGGVEPTRPARRAEEDPAAENGEESVGDDQSDDGPDLGPPSETAHATAYARNRAHCLTPSIHRVCRCIVCSAKPPFCTTGGFAFRCAP